MSSNNFLDPSLHDQDAPEIKHQPPPPGMDGYYHAPMPHHQPQPHPQPQPQQQQQQQQSQQQQQQHQQQVMNVPAAVQEGAMPPQSDVDEFLRKKRKAREHKACYPCRQRKVKCDLSRPCQTCRDRDHPELCSYHPPNKRQAAEQPAPAVPVPRSEDGFSASGMVPATAGNVTLSQAQFDMLCNKLHGLEESITQLRNEISRNSQGQAPNNNHDPALYAMREDEKNDPNPNLSFLSNGQTPNGDGKAPQFQRHAATHGVHAKNEMGQTVHFGAGSIPAFLISMRNGGNTNLDEAQEVLNKSILPMFGLDNESATYPFVDLWGLPHGSIERVQELAKALPTDSQSLSFFRYYRDMAFVIYPGLAQLELFEEELNQFLVVRAANDAAGEGVSEQEVHGQDFHWLGLLFAVLASGAQSSQMQRKERELTSQVYICCAMECLRIVNFLSQVKLETVQTLLIIQNVLTNNMNAATAWALHGLTIRLAQGLGIHQPCPPEIPRELAFPRSKLWWGVVWQDSLLSIIYDRASGPTTATKTTMPMPMRYGNISEYHRTMYPLVQVGLEIVRDRERINEMTTHEMHEKIAAHRETISQLMRDSAEYLRDSRKCTSPQQTLEHWALYLHTSYTLSELCRPAISNRRANREMLAAYKPLCVDNLINTVEAFLGLNNITAYARQSWAAIHRGLGSALLLGILGEHNKNDRARHLLARFISAIHDITTNIDPNEVAAPLQRGISALNRLGISEVPGGQQRYEEHLNDAGVALGADGALKLEHNPAMYTTPNSEMGSGDEQSPYSVLNTILWGATNPMVQQTHGHGHLPVPGM